MKMYIVYVMFYCSVHYNLKFDLLLWDRNIILYYLLKICRIIILFLHVDISTKFV